MTRCARQEGAPDDGHAREQPLPETTWLSFDRDVRSNVEPMLKDL